MYPAVAPRVVNIVKALLSIRESAACNIYGRGQLIAACWSV